MIRPAPLPQDIGLPRALPDGPLRLTVFGTSLSAPPQIWPDRLADALSTCRGAPVTAARVVGPGMGSAWALGQVGRVATSAPDLILLEFSINDADLRDGVSRARALAQHLVLLSALRVAQPEAQIALMTMSPAHGTRGWVRPRLAAHYAQSQDIAAAKGTGLMDLYPRWLALPRADRGLAADGLHPDPEVAAGVIVPALQILCNRPVATAVTGP